MPPTAQDALRGPVSTCSVQCSPASRPAPWPGTSARIGPLGPRRRRRRNAGQAAALATVDLVRASHGQPRTIPLPSGPMPAGHHAAHRPQAHRPAAPGRAARHTEPLRVQRGADRSGGSAADTRGLSVRTPGWHRTPGHRTPGRWMSARPVGRTSHGGPDEADRATTDLAGVRTPRDRRPPARRPDLAGSRHLGALGHPRRLRGDGTCAAALTAATTGPLPSTAGIRPRPGALLSSDDYGSSVEPAEKLHPLWQGARRDRHKLEQARSGFDQGVVSELRAVYSGVRCAGVGWRRRGE
jgi:hypothetical protein